MAQAPRLPLDDLHRPLAVLGGRELALALELREHLDLGQRRTKLVGHAGDEVVPEALEALLSSLLDEGRGPETQRQQEHHGEQGEP